MSTTSDSTTSFGQLDLADYSWLRVDIGDLSGVDASLVLRARVDPGPIVGAAPARGKIGDLVGTSWAALFLVSRRFVQVASSAQLSGWRVTPLEVTENPAAAGLMLLQVIGTCGPVETQGGFRSLEVATWDRSDFFVASNEATIFLSERATYVLKTARLRNVEVTMAGVELA